MGKKTVNSLPIDLGISEKDRARIAQGLSHLLADTYTLYLKTHNFHWNVKGPMFQTLHLMFETQYTELALAVDLIAERIRALGFPAPGTYSEYAKLSSIKETSGVPEATEMIRLLVEGQEAVTRTARKMFPLRCSVPAKRRLRIASAPLRRRPTASPRHRAPCRRW